MKPVAIAESREKPERSWGRPYWRSPTKSFGHWAIVLSGLLLLGPMTTSGLCGSVGSHSVPSADISSLPRTVIVFSGFFDRVDLGLHLLEKSLIDSLFISGANPGSGKGLIDDFAKQFDLSPQLEAAFVSRRIVVATKAKNTIENAIEAACWLERQSDIREIVLITSEDHMARASLALRRALPASFRIVALSPEGSKFSMDQEERTWEYRKLVATWLITLLPRRLWSDRTSELCNAG